MQYIFGHDYQLVEDIEVKNGNVCWCYFFDSLFLSQIINKIKTEALEFRTIISKNNCSTFRRLLNLLYDQVCSALNIAWDISLSTVFNNFEFSSI